jgi:hypothetical protein
MTGLCRPAKLRRYYDIDLMCLHLSSIIFCMSTPSQFLRVFYCMFVLLLLLLTLCYNDNTVASASRTYARNGSDTESQIRYFFIYNYCLIPNQLFHLVTSSFSWLLG